MSEKVSEQETASRRPGRPDYKPSDEQRLRVLTLKAEGATVATIAADIKVSPGTLRKYFKVELGGAATEVVVEAKAPELDFGQAVHTPDKVATMAPAEQGGRPPFEPTDRQRHEVKLGKADGWSNDEIAAYIGISRNTLSEHFSQELAAGVREKRMTMLRQLWVEVLAGSISAFDRFSKLKGMVNPADLAGDDFDDDDIGPEADEVIGKKEQANRAAVVAPPEGSPWAKVAPKFNPNVKPH